MIRPNRRAVVLTLVVAAVAFAGYRLTRHETPAGQFPLAYFDGTALATLQADFNAAVDHTRIILLLAPT